MIIIKMAEDKKELIIKVLKQFSEEKFSVTQLHSIMKNVSYPTLLKWLAVLEAEKKVRVEDYGNIKFVSLNNDYFDSLEEVRNDR